MNMKFRKVPFEERLHEEINDTFRFLNTSLDLSDIGHIFYWGQVYGNSKSVGYWYVDETTKIIVDSVNGVNYILFRRMIAEVSMFKKMFSDNNMKPYIQVLIDFDMTGSQVIANVTFDSYDWRKLDFDLESVWDYYRVETVGSEYLKNGDNLADVNKMQEYAAEHDETLHYQVVVDDFRSN
ncbi:hypothetical protein D3P96_00450 [Weissella viridescens]|uniref:Uncharacterized protein n=1 Tax=Weissella viridescens TaxID=1629 RepID=A0A3P2RCZ5_WEIVI|nr:hypothetical protein [Weissella viridescens]RRG18493.1 hypothetical protein D3P96_00450 [Weissella viridescens]